MPLGPEPAAFTAAHHVFDVLGIVLITVLTGALILGLSALVRRQPVPTRCPASLRTGHPVRSSHSHTHGSTS